MRAKLAVALFLVSTLLGASGPYTARLAPEDLRGIRTVAVVSALGGTFQFEHVANTPYEWLRAPDAHFLEISDWGLDPWIQKTTSAALAKRFTVKPIAFRPADFSTWNDALLKRAALDLNGDPAIDAYVLVLRDWRSDEIGYSVHELGGLGLYRRDSRALYGVYACYRVVVVDALTGETLASRAALLPQDQLPWQATSASLWPKTPNVLTTAQRARLLDSETTLIKATLLHTLAQMNLTR